MKIIIKSVNKIATLAIMLLATGVFSQVTGNVPRAVPVTGINGTAPVVVTPTGTVFNLSLQPCAVGQALIWQATPTPAGYKCTSIPVPSDFWRSGVGATTLPDGSADLTESIRRNGSIGVNADATTMLHVNSAIVNDTGFRLEQAKQGMTQAAGIDTVAVGVDATGKVRVTNSIGSADNRAIDSLPQAYQAGSYNEFKQSSAVGMGAISPGVGTFVGLQTFRKYGFGSDFSGGQVRQEASTDDGRVYYRMSTSATTWGAWVNANNSAAQTEWLLAGTATDAGADKTSAISRSGRVNIGTTAQGNANILNVVGPPNNQVNIAAANGWGLLLGYGDGTITGGYHGLNHAAVINVNNAPLHLGSNNASVVKVQNGGVGVGLPYAMAPSTQVHINAPVANDTGLRLEQTKQGVTQAAGIDTVAVGVDATGKVRVTNSLGSADNRGVDSPPQAYAAGSYNEFKQSVSIGMGGIAPGVGSFVGLQTFRAYGFSTDLSGGPVRQEATTADGRTYYRMSTGATTWGAWIELAPNLDLYRDGGKANHVMTGGGTVTLNAANQLSWTQRFIILGAGRGTVNLSSAGYYDINMPAVGTVITGMCGVANAAVTAGGIDLDSVAGSWSSLWYQLPAGASSFVPANLRHVGYTADCVIPNDYVLVAAFNYDNQSVRLGTGQIVKTGQTNQAAGNDFLRSDAYGGSALPNGASDNTKNVFLDGNMSLRSMLNFRDLNDGRNTVDGLTWYAPTPTSYGLYRTAGAWSGPAYQQAKLAFDTGIELQPSIAGSATPSYSKSYVNISAGGLRVERGRTGLGTLAPVTNLQLGNKVIDDANIVYDPQSTLLVHQAVTSTTVLNDPKTVLTVARQGTGGQAYGAAANFNLSRFANVGVQSNTRLDLTLANLNYADNPVVMTWLSNGRIIMPTTPNYASVAAANADSTLGVGTIYTVTAGGGKALYIK